MKRLFVVLFALLFFASTSFAAGSCVAFDKPEAQIKGKKFVYLSCTGDGSITAFSFNPKTYGVYGWYLYRVTTDPGTSAPTADYDITLVLAGQDIAGGLLADRSATLTETQVIATSTLNYNIVKDTFAITFANNSANPSTIELTLEFIEN